MHHLSKKSTAIIHQLIHGLDTLGAHRKIATSNTFLPVSVECIAKTELGLVFSIAHYAERNGDLVQHPEMEFLRGFDGEYYPLAITHGFLGIREEASIWENGNLQSFYPQRQKSQVAFANEWMKNIQEQQRI